MFNDIIRYQLQWHFYVLISIERCFEIHILDVCTAEFGIGHTDNAVPHDFGWNHIGCLCSELIWVIDQISTDCDVHAVGIILLS